MLDEDDERAFNSHRAAAIEQKQHHPRGRILEGSTLNIRLDEICSMRAQPSVTETTLSEIRELIKTAFPDSPGSGPGRRAFGSSIAARDSRGPRVTNAAEPVRRCLAEPWIPGRVIK